MNLALLRLSDKLPLDARNDMSWIILDDAENYDGPCIVNFYIRNSLQGAPNYIQSEQLPLLDSDACEIISKYPNTREDDICSYYYLPTGFNINKFESLQHYNGDRGTGFVCDNKLVEAGSTLAYNADDLTTSTEQRFNTRHQLPMEKNKILFISFIICSLLQAFI
ncbi:hypothetical protein DOY81_011248 [Sarcophaga bullata]|nr:hypothetical protein DOY81_011248 [Sarcophaga bullata]